jgi:predicted nucleic acid-binding protein
LRLVLDASVVVAAVRPGEPSFAAARGRVDRALRGLDELVIPPLLAIEVAAVLARAKEPEAKIRELVERLTSPPHLVVPLGPGRAARVVDIALSGQFRGADVTYVWLASARRLPLCTLDREMTERARAFCKVIGP